MWLSTFNVISVTEKFSILFHLTSYVWLVAAVLNSAGIGQSVPRTFLRRALLPRGRLTITWEGEVHRDVSSHIF